MTTPRSSTRRTLRRIALAAMLGSALAASPAAAQVTSLTMQSEPGDYIGGGRTYAFTPADGTFSANGNWDGGVSLSFHGWDWAEWWYLDFAAADAAPLAVGVYPGATRFPFQGPGEPGLDVSGDGRGCNMLTGSFEVKEIAFGAANDVLAFRATFEQHCEGWPAALTGEIRYNATVPVALSAPAAVTAPEGEPLTFTVSAVEQTGRIVALSATGLPAGASFVDNGDDTGTFSWTPPSGTAGTYRVTFDADNGLGASDTASTLITVIPPPPVNDELAGAVVVAGVPFTYTEDTSTATSSPQDPYCYGTSHTVWFAFTASEDGMVEANTTGSAFDTTLGAYVAGPYGLSSLACNDDSMGLQSRVRIRVVAGTTYYFVAGSLSYTSGGLLIFNVVPAPPPLAIDLALLRSGDVSLTSGAATVNGTITCNRPTYASVSGQLSQPRAGAAPAGYFWASVLCDGKTSFSAPVQSPVQLFRGRAVALFKGGPAKASASAWAYDPDTWESVQSTAAATIILRGGR